MRSVIEGLAVRLAIRRHQPGDLEAMDQSLSDLRQGLRRKLNEWEAARLALQFHDAIFRAAHHDRLYESCRPSECKSIGFYVDAISLMQTGE